MNYLKTVDKVLPRIAPFAFIVLTLLYSILRVPFFDEAYAYIISGLKVSEIFYLARIEGHPVLWYLMLKLTDFDIYPYSMLILNWIIAAILILFLWKKAPFNNLIKFLITFSYPFFNYFGVIARPYGLSVLAIFLLCYFYKSSLKKPILFSVLIVFCANTTAMGMFGALSFFVLFIYNVYLNFKDLNKKALLYSLLILFLGGFFFAFQFFNLQIPPSRPLETINEFKTSVLSFLFFPFKDSVFQTLFCVSGMLLFYFVSFLLFRKDKKALFFILFVYFLMTIFFVKVYIGAMWHYYFYFVYLIAGLWLCWDKIKLNKILNFLLVIFFVLSLNSYSFYKKGYDVALDTSYYPFMLNKILNNDEYRDSKLFCLDWFSPFSAGLLPYFKKNNIKIYDLNGYDRTTLKSLELTPKYYNTPFFGDDFIKYLDKNKNNYLITQNYFFSQGFIAKNVAFVSNKKQKGFKYVGKKSKIFFEIKENYPNIPFSVYKINYE